MISRRIALAALPGTAVLAAARAPGGAEAHGPVARDLVGRYFRVWNEGALDDLDAILSPDYVNHTPSTPNPPRGAGGLKPIIVAFRAAFPDLHFAIEEVIATADTAVARVVMTGTHRGALFGIPATGRAIRVDQINIERISAGRIVEHWRVTDELKLLRQLGIVPEQGR